MALIRKIGEIEVYEIDKDLSKYTRKEREKIVNELFRNEYVGKEIKYLIKDKEIKAIIDKFTRKNAITKIHNGFNVETNKEHNIKIGIMASGDYLSLINDARYTLSNKEQKTGQNEVHKENTVWHYFQKKIIVNNQMFLLKISIRKSNNKYFIYSTKLKEAS